MQNSNATGQPFHKQPANPMLNYRQQLGQALSWLRRQRKNQTVADVAHRCETSQSEVNDWESGKSVPRGKQWELFRLKVHSQLSNIRPIYQKACAEEDAEIEAVKAAKRSAKLASIEATKPKVEWAQPKAPKIEVIEVSKPMVEAQPKPLITPTNSFTIENGYVKEPFNAPRLKLQFTPEGPFPTALPTASPIGPKRVVVPVPPPKLQVEQPKVHVKLVGKTGESNWDISKAYAAAQAIPKEARSKESSQARFDFAVAFLRDNLDASTEQIRDAVRNKFGVSVDRARIKDIRKKAARPLTKAEIKAQERLEVKEVNHQQRFEDFAAASLPSLPTGLSATAKTPTFKPEDFKLPKVDGEIQGLLLKGAASLTQNKNWEGPWREFLIEALGDAEKPEDWPSTVNKTWAYLATIKEPLARIGIAIDRDQLLNHKLISITSANVEIDEAPKPKKAAISPTQQPSGELRYALNTLCDLLPSNVKTAVISVDENGKTSLEVTEVHEVRFELDA